MYYHPDAFVALRALLQGVASMRSTGVDQLDSMLAEHGCDTALAAASAAALIDAGLPGAVAHCRQHSSTIDDFCRHFHRLHVGGELHELLAEAVGRPGATRRMAQGSPATPGLALP